MVPMRVQFLENAPLHEPSRVIASMSGVTAAALEDTQ